MAGSRRRGPNHSGTPHPVAEARTPPPRRVTADVDGRRRRRPARRSGPSSTQLAVGAGVAIMIAAAAVLLIRSGTGSPSGPSGSSADVPVVGAGSLAQGQPAPDFTGTTLDGQKLTLSSLRGKPVLVNFFASWCTSCEHELPATQGNSISHKARGFAVVADNSLEKGAGVAFSPRSALSSPAVHDPGQPGPIAFAYGITNALPASVFIDKSGKVDH